MEHGLRVGQPRLLGGYSNTLIWLHPLPLVARVANATGTVRTDISWMRRELHVADFLSRHGVDVVRPSGLLPPGPHKQNGLALTFWEYIETSGERPSPASAGTALALLHAALATFTGPLPKLGPITEAWDLLCRGDIVDRLGPEQRGLVGLASGRVRDELDLATLAHRPLHGDAHYGNLLTVDGRATWADFEDVSSGPLEWDLACLVSSSRVLGSGAAAAEALGAYGAPFDAELLATLVKVRTLQAIAWALVSLPHPLSSPRLQARLAWLARTAV